MAEDLEFGRVRPSGLVPSPSLATEPATPSEARLGGWNYRVMRIEYPPVSNLPPDVTYQIHEVYYERGGAVRNWTERGASVSAESRDELLNVLAMMIDALGHPVLDHVTGHAIEPKRELTDALRSAIRQSADYFETDDGKIGRVEPPEGVAITPTSDGEASKRDSARATEPKGES